MTADVGESMSSMRFMPGAAWSLRMMPSMEAFILVRSSASWARSLLVASSRRFASMVAFCAASWVFLALSLGI